MAADNGKIQIPVSHYRLSVPYLICFLTAIPHQQGLCWRKGTAPEATRFWYHSRSQKRPWLQRTNKTIKTKKPFPVSLHRHRNAERPQSRGGVGGCVWCVVCGVCVWCVCVTNWGRRGGAADSWPRGCRPPAAWGALPSGGPTRRCDRSPTRSSRSCHPRNTTLWSGRWAGNKRPQQ